MGAATLRAQLPALPDPALFNDPRHTILSACGGALLTYDPATRAGFIYLIESGRWHITAPVEFDVFASIIAAAEFRIADGDDARRWLAACMPRPGKVH